MTVFHPFEDELPWYFYFCLSCFTFIEHFWIYGFIVFMNVEMNYISSDIFVAYLHLFPSVIPGTHVWECLILCHKCIFFYSHFSNVRFTNLLVCGILSIGKLIQWFLKVFFSSSISCIFISSISLLVCSFISLHSWPSLY